MGRVFLAAIVYLITNLIVGSISVSLGLIVMVILVGVLAVAIVLLSVLGFCIVLEKMGWVSPGWTDAKIDRLKAWAKQKWRNMPEWYREEKKRIIRMLIETLKGKGEETEDSLKIWKSVVTGLIVILAIVIVKHYFQVSVGWALAIVAIGSLLITFPVLYIMSRRQEPSTSQEEPSVNLPAQPSPKKIAAATVTSDEMDEALQGLLELQRTGKLKQLLESPLPNPSETSPSPETVETESL
jgi:hypothetical protein